MAVEMFFEPAQAAPGDIAFWDLPVAEAMPQAHGTTVTRLAGILLDEHCDERVRWWAQVTGSGQAFTYQPRATFFVRNAPDPVATATGTAVSP
jgi:hypothetical protein